MMLELGEVEFRDVVIGASAFKIIDDQSAHNIALLPLDEAPSKHH